MCREEEDAEVPNKFIGEASQVTLTPLSSLDLILLTKRNRDQSEWSVSSLSSTSRHLAESGALLKSASTPRACCLMEPWHRAGELGRPPRGRADLLSLVRSTPLMVADADLRRRQEARRKQARDLQSIFNLIVLLVNQNYSLDYR